MNNTLNNQEFLKIYQILPTHLQREVVDFMLFIAQKKIKNETQTIPKRRVLGLWKDKITYIAPDFNAPLDDLADYM